MKDRVYKEMNVVGMVMDTNNKKTNMRMRMVTVRATSDQHGQSLSLACDSDGIMIQVPLEPLQDIVRMVTEE